MRLPTEAELQMHDKFMKLRDLTISDLQAFVKTYQPDAKLRNRDGYNIRIGRYFPPQGGPQIVDKLSALLTSINRAAIDSFTVHIEYELLHPFSDCNGRSGRVIWYWMMQGTPLANLGFLHGFYYQTLHSRQ
jgi:Fic family protein